MIEELTVKISLIAIGLSLAVDGYLVIQILRERAKRKRIREAMQRNREEAIRRVKEDLKDE